MSRLTRRPGWGFPLVAGFAAFAGLVGLLVLASLLGSDAPVTEPVPEAAAPSPTSRPPPPAAGAPRAPLRLAAPPMPHSVWPLPRHEDERDPFGRRATPGDPWEVHATHLQGRDEVLVMTWRMRLPPVEQDVSRAVTPEVFAAFVEPRDPSARPVERVWIVLHAWELIWGWSDAPRLRTRANTWSLRVADRNPWRGRFDVGEQSVLGWLSPPEFAAAARGGIEAIDAGGLTHDVPARARTAFARLAERLPPDPAPAR